MEMVYENRMETTAVILICIINWFKLSFLTKILTLMTGKHRELRNKDAE